MIACKLNMSQELALSTVKVEVGDSRLSLNVGNYTLEEAVPLPGNHSLAKTFVAFLQRHILCNMR